MKPDNASVILDTARLLEQAARALRAVASGDEYATNAARKMRLAKASVDAADARLRAFSVDPVDYR